MHQILLAAHLLAVAFIFAAIGVELGLLRALGRASTKAEAELALFGSRVSRVIGPVGLLGALASGVALAAQIGEAATSWVAPSAVMLVVVIVTGAAVTGRKMMRIERNPAAPIRDRTLWISFALRTVLLVAILVLMVVKP
jgi:uncharacterized membrane protein